MITTSERIAGRRWGVWTMHLALLAIIVGPVASFEFTGWSDGLVFDDEVNPRSRVKRQEAVPPDYGSGDYFMNEDKEEFFRFRIQVSMPYTPAFGNKNSGEFAIIQDKLKHTIGEIYERVAGDQSIRVVKIEPIPRDPQFINVSIDLGTIGYYDQEELTKTLKRFLDTGAIQGVPVTYERPFHLSPLPTSGGANCRSNEFECGDGQCIPENLRCNGGEDCRDASDERDCLEIVMKFTSPAQGNELRSYNLEWIVEANAQIVSYKFSYRPARSSDPWKEVDVAGASFPAAPGRYTFTSLEPNTQYELVAKVTTFRDRDGIEVGTFNFITKGCEPEEFACRDGSCISRSQHCNGVAECRDGSDEEGCPARCNSNEFLCVNDGICISRNQVCDNFPHCRDGSDERDCPRACTDSEFRCNDGTCIDNSQHCDSRVDCPDGSDELNCPRCRSDQFTCQNGACIPANEKCDGIPQCTDRSDEVNCPCREGQFRCLADGRCIDENQKCDGIQDCSDRSDENNCPCGSYQFACGDGQCLEEDQVCNGIRECPDGRDERDCPVPEECDIDSQYPCDLSCIPLSWRCNGRRDCVDGKDELYCPCRNNTFDCRDGTCISQSQVCDGTPDCTNDLDERDCPTCRADQFTCNDNTCIDRRLYCDRSQDCPDGSDERGCPCPPNYYTCGDGQCIEASRQCNGVADCSDSSDEHGCPTCRSNEFMCGDRTCIPSERKCDGIPDCRDRSDEAECQCQSDEFSCDGGRCLKNDKKCDGQLDCRDYTDEDNCPCSDGQFTCDNGECIPDFRRCDNQFDCTDRSDEENCRVPCRSDQFECGDGTCIDLSRKCDRTPDCRDRSDELNCTPIPCRSDEFTCGDGTCIELSRKCDRYPDCRDSSDERDCPPIPCRSDQFECDDGSCIELSRKCDRYPDCRDNSDELDCGPPPCRIDQFQCGDGTCIELSRKCDRYSDCRDNSDEHNCQPVPCRSDQFQCGDGTCIDLSRKCDRSSDCRDNSDELNCSPVTVCPRGMFRCRTGQCIPETDRCNNVRDCIDGSDESDCASPREGIVLKTYPPDQTIKEGQEVVFQCRDEGQGRHPVSWRRQDRQPMPPNTRDRNGRLTMPDIQMRHAGSYVCYVTDVTPGTPGSELTVDLRVQQLPNQPPRPHTCGVNEATCMNGDCIPKNKVCDQVNDCSDGSDELRCSPIGDRCQPNEFTCDNTRCVMKTWRCDGDDDCGDASDENNCGQAPTDTGCNVKEFKCAGADQCVPKSFHCDGETDCVDGSDETGCSKPIVSEIERMVMVQIGETFIIRCRAIGIPTPVIVWRRNWGHVPDKCTQQSVDGAGTLTCPDAEISDQGAYTCEALNIKGSVMGVPDTILKVKRSNGTCRSPYYNDYAKDQSQCEQCFCFGAQPVECVSSKLFVAKLPPPERNYYQIIGAQFNDRSNSFEILTSDPLSQSYMTSPSSSVVKVSVPDVSRLGGRQNMVTYFALPSSHLGDLTKSYGGSIEYMINFKGPDAGRPLIAPDVILQGDGDRKIFWMRGTPFSPNVNNKVKGEFAPGQWYKEIDTRRGFMQGRGLATRPEIMMILQNVRYFLIRAQYQEELRLDSSMADVQIDTAVPEDTGGGQAVLVEECRCPPGYTGLSCQRCAPGYDRKRNGLWLGECERTTPACATSEYYDTNTRRCEKCPCIGSEALLTCQLDGDGRVTCNCPTGYIGRRCELCEPGFIGNPTRGDPCVRSPNCNEDGTQEQGPNGECRCKEYVAGDQCDRCQSNTFSLTASNPRGCVTCFCMGITRDCSGSSLYRNQIASTFSNNRNGFQLVSQNRGSSISDDLEVDRQSYQLKFSRFRDVPQDIYYWQLPESYTGNKLTSYGGELKFTVRYSGGGGYYNNVPDVEIEGNGERILHYIKEDIPPDTDHEVTVRMVEYDWVTFNRGQLNRENMMMALADIDFIIIKATYSNNSREVRLSSVSLDTAEQRNTGQQRAHEVEECRCPPEYTGLSCEDCQAGYFKGGRGLYLGQCEPCQCNNHADTCYQNGTCKDCRDNTEGDNCERCIRGYVGDATAGYPDSCRPGPISCECDPAGSLSTTCPDGVNCQCKDNVVGARCNQCRPGTFNLDESNPLGCTACFCSGVINKCTSEVPPRAPVITVPLDNSHGYVLTDRYGTDIISDGIQVDRRRNELGYSNLEGRAIYYWSLPRTFTGNKLTAYGGTLTYTQRFESVPGASFVSDVDVALEGNGVTIFWNYPSPLQSGQSQTVEVPLRPSSEWQRMERSRTSTATRQDFLKILANIESIHIRASFSSDVRSTYLSDVRLQMGQSSDMERCSCPVGYSGRSCEDCSPGYYRDAYDQSLSVFGACKPCDCNQREERCYLGGDGLLQCECRPEYSGRNCETEVTTCPRGYFQCQSGQCIREDSHCNGVRDCTDGSDERGCGTITTTSPAPPDTQIRITVREPRNQIVTAGDTVRFYCEAQTRYGERLPTTWSRQEGSLPIGRYNSNGELVITSTRQSDSGTYVCTASDGYTTNTALAYLSVGAGPTDPIDVDVSPTSYEGRPGEDVRLECRIESAGSVQWSKAAGRLPTNSYQRDGVLIIRNPTVQDQGEYICTAIFSSGLQRQKTVIVTITITPGPIIPTARIEPERQTVPEGTIAELRCIVTGTPQPRITWTREPGELPNRAQVLDDLLRIRNVSSDDRGYYKCEAQNSAGSAIEYAVLDVERNEPPRVRIYPEPTQSALIGGTVQFQCVAEGIPTPQVSWSKQDGQPLPATANASGGDLRFIGINGNEGGVYVCNAVSSAGIATALVTLTVQSRPSLTVLQQSPYTVNQGDRVVLECRASGSPAPSVYWQGPRGFPREDRVAERPLTSNVAKLVINNVQVRDAGEYMCVANNAAGQSESALTLVVQQRGPVTPPPTASPNVPLNISQAMTGSRVHFRCILEGAARGDYVTWEREGAALPVNHILSRGDLYINNVERQDAGTYACVVVNSQRGVRTTLYRTELRVTSALRVELTPEQQVVSPGDTVYLRCDVVSGRQPVNIRWEAASGRMPNTVVTVGGVLEFRGIRKSDAGLYRCIATNAEGRATGEAEVNVRDAPGPTIRPVISAVEKLVEVQVGGDATLRCETEGGRHINWRRDRGLPPNVFMNIGILRISRVQLDNAGRYTCLTNLPGGRQASDFIDLVVQPVDKIEVKIISSISTIKMGDVVYLLCEVKGDQSATVQWSKVDSDRLPGNVNATGPRLKVENVRADNGGLYRCSVTTDSGKSTYKDFVFTIVDGPLGPPEDVRRAAYGSTVVLECQNTLERPVSFSWTKQGERLPTKARVAQGRLSIPDIRAEDAGTYICTSRNAKVAKDDPVILVVTDVVPYFNQAQNSYIAFPPLRDAYHEFDIELSLKPESPNGLILYSSKERSRNSDFLSLGLRDGYPEFQFDLGAGPAIRNGSQRLSMGEWHTIRLKRNRKNGSLEVDGSDPFSVTAAGHHQGLDLYEPLHLGGLPDFSVISGNANYNTGFQGCISRLVIGGVIQELMVGSSQSSGITSCDTCGSNPCLNLGMCQEAYTHEGYKCICAPGYAGPTCGDYGEACYPGACGDGRCENKPEGGFECYCPLGKSGNRCERDIVIFEPAFAEGSYAAYPTPLVDRASLNRMEFGMNVMPKSVEDGLLMYCAQRENGKGDFTSLAIKDKRVEFRFDTGSGPAVLRSKRDVRPGEWINIRAERQFKRGKLIINRNETIRGKSPGATRGLNLRTPLFVGGVNKQKVRVSAGTGVNSGFSGCVSEVEMSSLDLDMIKSVTDAANVGQCQDRAICERHPDLCLNGATCENDADEQEGFRCVCLDGFSGRRCEKQDNMCSKLEPCQNGGSCRGTRKQYKCICPLGFYGENCQIPIDSGTSALFNGQGFMEFPKSMFPHRNYLQKEIISFDFSTTASNGLLFWQGQGEHTDGRKQDFVALAVVDGHVQFGYQLGSGVALINSTIKVNDGKRHSVMTIRKGRNGSLSVDGVTVNGSSVGFLQMLNTAGNIYLGGVPRQNFMTGDMYEHGFSGCIESLNIQNGGIVDLYRQGSRASDVQPCDRDIYNGQDASINEI